MTPYSLTRRSFLGHAAAMAAFSQLSLRERLSVAAAANGGHPLAPKPGHFPPKAKHLILFFFTGGLSHVDTFDYKPKLQEDHGKKVSGASKPLKGARRGKVELGVVLLHSYDWVQAARLLDRGFRAAGVY